MAFKLKIGFVWYCLCSLVVCHNGNTGAASFEIRRGDIDTFTNLECQIPNKCTDEQCEKYGAECGDDKCEYCQCKVGSGTFLASDSTTGICTKDENIIPESVPKQSFRLEKVTNDTRKLTNQCLTVADEKNYNISGKNCTSCLNMHWILTGKRMENQNKRYLTNIMTLQCLEFLTSTFLCTSKDKYQTGEVVLKQCKQTDGQYVTPGQKSTTIRSRLCSGRRNYYLRLKMERNDVLYPAFSQRNKPDRWTNSKKDDLHLYTRPTTYRGCYRFQNGKFMLYLDNETCHENPCSHQFFAPIFYENTKCDVEWSKSKILFSQNVQWQNVTENSTGKLVSIESGHGKSSSIKMLKVYQEASMIFNGSLLRLAISCANEKNPKLVENQCLLLKFKSLPRNGEMTTTSTKRTTSSKMITLSTLTTLSKMTTSPTVKTESKDIGESSIYMIAIIAVLVSLLAIILVLTLVCCVCHRKNKRKLKLLSINHQDRNEQPKDSTLLLNPLQPSNSNQSTQRISQHYDVPCERPYRYVDKTAIVPPQTFTYDYAFVDGPLKNNHKTRVGLDGTGENDYEIMNDAKMMQETQDNYVVRDESYVSVID